MIRLTAENFTREVLLSKSPVLVEFYSHQCRQCAMMEDIIESLSNSLAGKVKVGRVDVNRSVSLKRRYEIIKTPTYIIFQNGIALGCMQGVLDERRMEERLMELIR